MSPTRFVILAAPRTGSNLLCTLLHSHPAILCHHELFNPQGIFYALERRDGSLDLGTMDERDRDPLGFLQRIWDHFESASCVGFKMTRGQSGTVMQHVITDHGVRKIVLRRANRLKTFVSHLIAEQTGQWEAYSDDDLPRQVHRVTIDVEALLAHTALDERFYETVEHQLRSSGQLWLDMSYETLLRQSEHRRLLEFLGRPADQTRLAPGSVKQNPRDVRDRIANVAELESALRGTSFYKELHDTDQ